MTKFQTRSICGFHVSQGPDTSSVALKRSQHGARLEIERPLRAMIAKIFENLQRPERANSPPQVAGALWLPNPMPILAGRSVGVLRSPIAGPPRDVWLCIKLARKLSVTSGPRCRLDRAVNLFVLETFRYE